MESKYIYFFIFLLISSSCEEFMKSKNRRNCKRRIQKRQNYEIIDEKEPLAQIDVSSFIHSPDESSAAGSYLDYIDNNSKETVNDYGVNNAAINTLDLVKAASQDYDNLKSEIPRNLDNERIPSEYNKRNMFSDSLKNHVKPIRNNFERTMNDLSFSNDRKHAEKKCALKNMKIPFFSRSKIETAKTKKNKKRKFSFHNSKKQNPRVTKVPESHLNSNSMQIPSTKPQNFKIKKRSYFSRLCPMCKRKVLNANLIEVKSTTSNNDIHDSRQYFQNISEVPKSIDFNRYDRINLYLDDKYQDETSDNVKDFRWKREIKSK